MKTKIISLVAFFVIVFAISGISSYITMPAVQDWYTTIEKPSFNPPNWIFAPVWTTLYIMIAISGWLVWNKIPGNFQTKLKNRAMKIYWAQLLANFLWSILFFGMHSPELALIDIAVLLFLIGLNIYRFKSINKYATYLLVPYFCWVAFASTLNLSVAILN